jgi:hypothetical protein
MTIAKEPLDYDLTCWYLNARRVIELVGLNSIAPDFRTLDTLGEIGDQLHKAMAMAVLKDAITQWLRYTKPPTLGQLLIHGNLRPNNLFTHYSTYFCKGSPQAWRARERGKQPIPELEAYSKLDEFRPNQRVRFHFHHEHLTSTSAWSELSGQRRLLVLGAATTTTDEVIDAIPWVIADPISLLHSSPSAIGLHWGSRLEVFVDSIDSFARVQHLQTLPQRKDLELLKAIPEADIKKAFAEIIGEPTVPQDWGGERSDLFTTFVKLNDQRISAAFAFKGPAKFRPLTAGDLGKNGDQIDRLFSEPADLLILQHCHEITPAVRSTMRAYAQQMGNPRLFCLINGYDTLRILRAYAKCGQTTSQNNP